MREEAAMHMRRIGDQPVPRVTDVLCRFALSRALGAFYFTVKSREASTNEQNLQKLRDQKKPDTPAWVLNATVVHAAAVGIHCCTGASAIRVQCSANEA